MTEISPISNRAGFLAWFGVVPPEKSVTEAYGDFLSEVAASPWLPQSEKDRIDALYRSGSILPLLAPPQINIAAYLRFALDFPNQLYIASFSGAFAIAAFGVP